MKTIPLTKGYETLVDDKDFEILSRYKWQALQQTEHLIYAQRILVADAKRTACLMHRIIMSAPSGIKVDHIDGNGLNNQRSNLRLCTNKQHWANCRTRKDNTSGVRGVMWNPQNQTWVARIQGKNIGSFKTLEGAKVARALSELAVFGERVPGNRT